jgi:hypothetical protein
MGRLSRVMEWLIPEMPWEEMRCGDCFRVFGKRQARMYFPLGGGPHVSIPDRVRCLECSGKAAAE